MVPRVIYTYWHRASPPELVRKCIHRMREAHPGWRVVVLTPMDVPDTVRTLAPNVASDWARLHVLAEYGGVWLDASCICLQSVTAWASDDCLSGFCSYDGCIDSYAIAAPSRSALVGAWRDEFCASLLNPHAYAQRYAHVARRCHIRWNAHHTNTLNDKLPYLNIVLCSAVARQKCGARLHLKDAYRSGGSFYFDTDSIFSSTPDTPLIKLDNVDRRKVARLLRCVTDDTSACARALHLSKTAVRRSSRTRRKTSRSEIFTNQNK